MIRKHQISDHLNSILDNLKGCIEEIETMSESLRQFQDNLERFRDKIINDSINETMVNDVEESENNEKIPEASFLKLSYLKSNEQLEYKIDLTAMDC